MQQIKIVRCYCIWQGKRRAVAPSSRSIIFIWKSCHVETLEPKVYHAARTSAGQEETDSKTYLR